MARFYAEIQGSRGEASRMGTPSSGMRGHIRGWHVGGKVYMRAEGDIDVCDIAVSGGSAGYRVVSLASARAGENGALIAQFGPAIVNRIRAAELDESGNVTIEL